LFKVTEFQIIVKTFRLRKQGNNIYFFVAARQASGESLRQGKGMNQSTGGKKPEQTRCIKAGCSGQTGS
jgi:hypothetical protein